MNKLRKWVYFAIVLFLLYYIFIANILVTLSVIATVYVIFKVFKIYKKRKLGKLINSKDLFKKSELGLFIALVAKVAKADGRVQEREAHLIGMMLDDISGIFPDKEKARSILKEIFNEEKENTNNTKEVALELNKVVGRSRLKRRKFVEFLIQLAFVDNGISTEEDKILREIVLALGINSDEYNEMLVRFENMLKNNTQTSMNLQTAYEILGVSQTDDLTTIKKTYRKLMRKYHPDIIKSQNKDEAYIEESTAKTQEINQAYEIIKEARK